MQNPCVTTLMTSAARADGKVIPPLPLPVLPSNEAKLGKASRVTGGVAAYFLYVVAIVPLIGAKNGRDNRCCPISAIPRLYAVRALSMNSTLLALSIIGNHTLQAVSRRDGTYRVE